MHSIPKSNESPPPGPVIQELNEVPCCYAVVVEILKRHLLGRHYSKLGPRLRLSKIYLLTDPVKPRESARGSDGVLAACLTAWHGETESVEWTHVEFPEPSLTPDGADTLAAGRDEPCFGLPGGGTPAGSNTGTASTTRSRAESAREEVSLASDWILGAGVAAEAAGDWSILVPVSQIYLTTERSRQSRFAQCQRGSSEHKRFYSQGSATCRRGSSGRNLSRQESRA